MHKVDILGLLLLVIDKRYHLLNTSQLSKHRDCYYFETQAGGDSDLDLMLWRTLHITNTYKTNLSGNTKAPMSLGMWYSGLAHMTCNSKHPPL